MLLLTRRAISGGSAMAARKRSTTVAVSQSMAADSSLVSSIWVTGSGSVAGSPSSSIGSWHTS